jgi:uncharacterized membrane protein YhfC
MSLYICLTTDGVSYGLGNRGILVRFLEEARFYIFSGSVETGFWDTHLASGSDGYVIRDKKA